MNLKRVWALLAAVLLTFALVACGDSDKKGDDGDKGDGGNADAAVINAVEYGVDNTGKTDMTDKMIAMHKEAANQGKPVYYPNGTYLFNGATLDFSSGVEFESMDGVTVRNSIADTNIINFDDAGNLIGLMHNHLEMKYDSKNPDAFVMSGNLAPAPLSTAQYETKVDFLTYWYNDFGLQRIIPIPNSWNGWYDWRWNHHDCQELDDGYEPYDPTRHPLLGWYRGDEVEVLDWQCYWLQEYGMKQMILLAGGWDESAWSDPNYGQYWVYNLLNNTPNAKTMKFATQVPSSSYGSDEPTIRGGWWNVFFNFYFNEEYKDMVYCYEKGGKRYPVINVWDEQSVRYSMDKSSDRVRAMYMDIAQAFKDNGYDGVCITARMPLFAGEANATVRAELEAAGVIWYSSAYPQNTLYYGATYAERVDSFKALDTDYTVYGVSTGMNTHDPHPSQWVCPGHTPALFGNLVSKVVAALEANPNQPGMITVYNVSEWSEGGPGLVPTVGKGFGYLEAIRDAVVR